MMINYQKILNGSIAPSLLGIGLTLERLVNNDKDNALVLGGTCAILSGCYIALGYLVKYENNQKPSA